MNEHTEPSPVIEGEPTGPSFEARAIATIGADSAQQVTLAGQRGAISMIVHSLRGDDLELIGSVFLPKNCKLEIQIQETGPDVAKGSRRAQVVKVRGTVRKLQMTSAEPTYAIWVRLEGCDPALLSELRNAPKARNDGLGSQSTTALGNSSIPSWATRLVDNGDLTESELEEVAALALSSGQALEETLISVGHVLEEKVSSCIALDLGIAFVDPRAYEINPENCSLIPEELARRHRLFPLFCVGGVITLGMQDPTDLAVIDQVRLRAKCQVDQCLMMPSGIDFLIDQAFRSVGMEASLAETLTTRFTEFEESDASSTNAIVQLVKSLVEESARGGVSDVHIEPERDKLRIRIRVDGILHEKAVYAAQLHAPIVSRIKVMAKLDIAESRRPQDGHFSLNMERGGTVDVRVSTIPTVHGENLVLRILLSDEKTIDLTELGMPALTLAKFEEFLAHPNGMVLVTGPTGSGKTTTLYAALSRLSTIERNIVTVEDPVEKRMPLLRQTEVNTRAGLTFAAGLRSFLRQDPDVIMVGEIRDRETAEIAVQAALTGHLVLSTLHTNTAAGAIVRMSEIGVPPFLITSSLRAVVSQRLVRRVCENCSTTIQPDPRLIAGLGLQGTGDIRYRAGSGCARCMHTGFKGRVGIYEMLELTPALSSALLSGASRDTIEAEAQRSLTNDLRWDGLQKVRAGLTTLEEIARIVGTQSAASLETDPGSPDQSTAQPPNLPARETEER